MPHAIILNDIIQKQGVLMADKGILKQFGQN